MKRRYSIVMEADHLTCIVLPLKIPGVLVPMRRAAHLAADGGLGRDIATGSPDGNIYAANSQR